MYKWLTFGAVLGALYVLFYSDNHAMPVVLFGEAVGGSAGGALLTGLAKLIYDFAGKKR